MTDTQLHSRTASWAQIDDDQCRRLSGALEFIGRRWSGSILLGMTRGATRFGEIRASVAGLSDRMLAARLKEFEHAGILTRIVEPTTPVSVRYELTPRGAALMAAVQPLAEFGEIWAE